MTKVKGVQDSVMFRAITIRMQVRSVVLLRHTSLLPNEKPFNSPAAGAGAAVGAFLTFCPQSADCEYLRERAPPSAARGGAERHHPSPVWGERLYKSDEARRGALLAALYEHTFQKRWVWVGTQARPTFSRGC